MKDEKKIGEEVLKEWQRDTWHLFTGLTPEQRTGILKLRDISIKITRAECEKENVNFYEEINKKVPGMRKVADAWRDIGIAIGVGQERNRIKARIEKLMDIPQNHENMAICHFYEDVKKAIQDVLAEIGKVKKS